MDRDAMSIIVLLVAPLTYIGTFIFGYGVRFYVESHENPLDRQSGD